MVSRDGWVAYDDHENFVLDENDWWVPNANRTGTQQNHDVEDVYGFYHGHDYAGALSDFTLISGKTIMVRRCTCRSCPTLDGTSMELPGSSLRRRRLVVALVRRQQ